MLKLNLMVWLLTVSFGTWAQSGEVFKTDDGAIRGYDPVAYFTEGKAVKGVKEFSYIYQLTPWYFSSAKNLEAFQKDPEKYAPQYGGYCAFGTAEGHKAPTEPEAWSIVNGKLYLNYNKAVQKEWKQDMPGYILKADQNWPSVKHE